MLFGRSGRTGSVLVRRLVPVALAAAGLLALPAPAQAAPAARPDPVVGLGYPTACGERDVAPLLSGFGDASPYFLAPGGAFEDGAPGWSLRGATTVPGSEPWRVLAAEPNARSLSIAAAGSATTPTICTTHGEDAFRFFLRDPGVAGAVLRVRVTAVNGGVVKVNEVDLPADGRGWRLSPRIAVPDVLDAGGLQYVSITFTPRGAQRGAWRIDDVLVDPWKTI